jgi:hypothetical protein
MPLAYNFETPKDPSEARVLTFDFSSDLDAGVTLVGIPEVEVTVSPAADNPEDILNGSPKFDSSHRQVLVPIKGGIGDPRSRYHIKIVATTTNPAITVAMVGILTVVKFL